MMHLDDEQFEDALRERASAEAAGHLAQCEQCRQTLQERQALRGRLGRAFDSVNVPAGLEERIRRQMAGQTVGDRVDDAERAPLSTARSRLASGFRRRVWPVLAAAAAILVMALPLALYFTSPSPAEAAEAQLVSIHKMNLSDGHGFYSEDEPAKLADYFRDKLGFVPAMPRLNQGMALRGCCVAHFRNQAVGSYAVNTPRGVISIIAVKDTPQAMGMKIHSTRGPQTYWSGAFAKNSLAAVRMGEFTYCAVGEVPVGSLVDLLEGLVPADK